MRWWVLNFYRWLFRRVRVKSHFFSISILQLCIQVIINQNSECSNQTTKMVHIWENALHTSSIFFAWPDIRREWWGLNNNNINTGHQYNETNIESCFSIEFIWCNHIPCNLNRELKRIIESFSLANHRNEGESRERAKQYCSVWDFGEFIMQMFGQHSVSVQLNIWWINRMPWLGPIAFYAHYVVRILHGTTIIISQNALWTFQ